MVGGSTPPPNDIAIQSHIQTTSVTQEGEYVRQFFTMPPPLDAP